MTRKTVSKTTEPKEGGHAIGASPEAFIPKPTPRKPHQARKHRDIPGPDQPEARGASIAKEFGKLSELTAAAKVRKTSPDYDRHADARRATTKYALGQLSTEQVAAIEVDYRAALKPVSKLVADHCISTSTLYALAEKRGWPSRVQVREAMAAAVQDNVVAAVAREQRIKQHGPSGADQALNPSALDVLLAGTADDHEQPITHRQLEEQGAADAYWEEYAIASAMVITKHRHLTTAAVEACDDLLAIQFKAITEAKERAQGLAHDPAALAKAVEPLVKLFNTTMTAMKAAIGMQREAFAIEGGDGKGLPMASNPDRDAMARRISGPDTPATQENDAPQDRDIPLAAGVGTYEALVLEAERRGERLAE